MKLRMAEVGGDCRVVSRCGEGCQVSFQMPLKQRSFFKSLFHFQNHPLAPGAKSSNQQRLALTHEIRLHKP
jgi:hypothetical protein